MAKETKQKSKYAPRGPSNPNCPFGHPWTQVTRKIGYCAHEMCQIAYVSGKGSVKTYFNIDGLDDLLEGNITEEEIVEREKSIDGDHRC